MYAVDVRVVGDYDAHLGLKLLIEYIGEITLNNHEVRHEISSSHSQLGVFSLFNGDEEFIESKVLDDCGCRMTAYINQPSWHSNTVESQALSSSQDKDDVLESSQCVVFRRLSNMTSELDFCTPIAKADVSFKFQLEGTVNVSLTVLIYSVKFTGLSVNESQKVVHENTDTLQTTLTLDEYQDDDSDSLLDNDEFLKKFLKQPELLTEDTVCIHEDDSLSLSSFLLDHYEKLNQFAEKSIDSSERKDNEDIVFKELSELPLPRKLRKSTVVPSVLKQIKPKSTRKPKMSYSIEKPTDRSAPVIIITQPQLISAEHHHNVIESFQRFQSIHKASVPTSIHLPSYSSTKVLLEKSEFQSLNIILPDSNLVDTRPHRLDRKAGPVNRVSRSNENVESFAAPIRQPQPVPLQYYKRA